MYAALVDGGFAIRASRMDLVPERFWRRQVADPTGDADGRVSGERGASRRASLRARALDSARRARDPMSSST